MNVSAFLWIWLALNPCPIYYMLFSKNKYMPFIDHKPVKTEDKCTSFEHDPPMHILLPAGTHTWKCPQCGHTKTFVVSEVLFGNK